MKEYNYPNEFDNVTTLIVSRIGMKDNPSYYFKNIKSLTLLNEFNYDHGDDYFKIQRQIESLHGIANLSNIKHLEIEIEFNTSFLLQLLKELPSVSSLKCERHILKPFYYNHELCEYLNKHITTLHISCIYRGVHIKSDEVDLICKTFSNVEQLDCHITKLDNLLSILRQCSKLSMLNLWRINDDIDSWYKMHASKLNVHINFID